VACHESRNGLHQRCLLQSLSGLMTNHLLVTACWINHSAAIYTVLLLYASVILPGTASTNEGLSLHGRYRSRHILRNNVTIEPSIIVPKSPSTISIIANLPSLSLSSSILGAARTHGHSVDLDYLSVLTFGTVLSSAKRPSLLLSRLMAIHLNVAGITIEWICLVASI
jgi:hypothetical protein